MTEDVNSKFFRIVSNDVIQVTLEYDHEDMSIHLDHFNGFSKTTYLEFIEMLDAIADTAMGFGYTGLWAVIPKENKSTQKLAQRVGFEHITSSPEGEQEVYLWAFMQ